MNDSLGDRMKQQYEDRTRYMLPRRTYTIIRLDGRAFHSLTRGRQKRHDGIVASYVAPCEKPFDARIQEAMAVGASAVLHDLAGAKFAYIQSDEASVLVTDFETPLTQAPFDGNIQKIVSTSAATMSVAFNASFGSEATFDARVFTIPDPVEVENYFIWRQKDWGRNSVQMLAQSLYSHNQLHGKKQSDMHEMIHAAGKNWADLTDDWKNGVLIERSAYPSGAFVFTKERGRLTAMIPRQWAEQPS
jgi:tRNA(His) 5'-end guanylyltransferase